MTIRTRAVSMSLAQIADQAITDSAAPKLPDVHVSVPPDDSVYPALHVYVTVFVCVAVDVAAPSTKPLAGAVAEQSNS